MSKKRREEIKKNQKIKKLIPVIAVVLVIVTAVGAIAAANIHTCDDCSARIIGKGYYKEESSQGVLSSVFGSIFGDTESIELATVEGVIICKECAMENTSVKAELRDVEEFRR